MLFHLQFSTLQSDQYSSCHCKKCPMFGVISQQPNEYWSDYKVENRTWKSMQNCMYYIYIILWYNQNSNTQLEPKFRVGEIVEPAKKPPVGCGSVFWCGKTHCNSSSLVPTWTRNWTPDLELSLTLLGIVISILPISSTLCQDGYHVRCKHNSKQSRGGANHTSLISLKQMCPFNSLSDSIHDAISSSQTNSDTNSEAIPNTISDSNPEAIPKFIPKYNSDHSQCRTLLEEGGLRQWLCEAVGEHLSSQYVAQDDLSISSHICSKIVLGCNVCNCSSAVDSVLDACDQWLWIGEHERGIWDGELVQEMGALCESPAAYSRGRVLGISHGLGSWLLFSWSRVDHASKVDDQSTCRFIVFPASSIVRINITSKCTFSISSESSSECSSECSSAMQTPVLHAVVVPKHAFQSYHMLIAQVMIAPAENSDGICDIRPSVGHRVYNASGHWSVYGWITGFFVGLRLVKLHCPRHGNWSWLIHSELLQDHPNVAVLMDVDVVMLPIAFNVHAEIDWSTPEIMHPEPLLHPILDLPNQALISNDEEIIDVQNHCGNTCAMIFKHEQSSIGTWCHQPNWDHEVRKSAVPNVQRPL